MLAFPKEEGKARRVQVSVARPGPEGQEEDFTRVHEAAAEAEYASVSFYGGFYVCICVPKVRHVSQ